MNFNIKNLDIKIRGKDKKKIFKILMILVFDKCYNDNDCSIFCKCRNLKNNYFISYVSCLCRYGYIYYKKENETVIEQTKENFENKYDPILTRFLVKNEFKLDNDLLNAEIYYLIKKGYVEIDREKNTLRLKDRKQFKQIDALERIDR